MESFEPVGYSVAGLFLSPELQHLWIQFSTSFVIFELICILWGKIRARYNDKGVKRKFSQRGEIWKNGELIRTTVWLIWMHEQSPPCSISVAVFFQAAKITGRKSPIARTRGIRLLTSRINSRVEAASAIPTDVRLLRGWKKSTEGGWAGDGRRDKRKSNRRRERRSEEKERHRCTYFYVIAVEAMHCCRETKANVAEKLRRKGEARGILALGWVSDGEKERRGMEDPLKGVGCYTHATKRNRLMPDLARLHDDPFHGMFREMYARWINSKHKQKVPCVKIIPLLVVIHSQPN